MSEDGRVRRGQETREARRTQIKQTALRVFSERGYHETSVSDLVDAAGVARGTFYLYFDSKDAIFLELLDDLTAHLRSNVTGIDLSPSAAPMFEQLHAIVVRILRTVVENRPLTRIIFREAVVVGLNIVFIFEFFFEVIIEVVIEIIFVEIVEGIIVLFETIFVAIQFIPLFFLRIVIIPPRGDNGLTRKARHREARGFATYDRAGVCPC